MALHPNFPENPHEILDPSIRWFPADEALRNTSFEKLLPPLVPELRKQVKKFRDSNYEEQRRPVRVCSTGGLKLHISFRRRHYF